MPLPRASRTAGSEHTTAPPTMMLAKAVTSIACTRPDGEGIHQRSKAADATPAASGWPTAVTYQSDLKWGSRRRYINCEVTTSEATFSASQAYAAPTAPNRDTAHSMAGIMMMTATRFTFTDRL